ncbi:MAG: hypothetical protein ACRDRL_17405 [Sciscionella sp.]
MSPHDDLVHTWSCAANLQLYDEDPAPRDVNVSTLDEPGIVDRRAHLFSVYACQLLQYFKADQRRLAAAAEASRRKARHVRTFRGSWEIMQECKATPG